MRSSERPAGAVWRLLDDWARREQAKDRFGRKITQGEMARLFGVSGQTVSAWKRCVARMQMAEQIQVVKNTDITHAELAAALAEDEPRISGAIVARNHGHRELADLTSAAALVARRYAKQADNNYATAASLLAHDGAKGSNADPDDWFAALEWLIGMIPDDVSVPGDVLAARRNAGRGPKGPEVQGAD